jgi:hypothetical protein
METAYKMGTHPVQLLPIPLGQADGPSSTRTENLQMRTGQPLGL